jgi:hypothetical protein
MWVLKRLVGVIQLFSAAILTLGAVLAYTKHDQPNQPTITRGLMILLIVLLWIGGFMLVFSEKTIAPPIPTEQDQRDQFV